jgi:hypothetical protein
MLELISRLLRTLAIGLIALIGLLLAFVFTFSTLIAIGILFVAAKLRGKRFSAQEYWTSRQSNRKPLFSARHPSHDKVTDVEARDIS